MHRCTAPRLQPHSSWGRATLRGEKPRALVASWAALVRGGPKGPERFAVNRAPSPRRYLDKGLSQPANDAAQQFVRLTSRLAALQLCNRGRTSRARQAALPHAPPAASGSRAPQRPAPGAPPSAGRWPRGAVSRSPMAEREDVAGAGAAVAHAEQSAAVLRAA